MDEKTAPADAVATNTVNGSTRHDTTRQTDIGAAKDIGHGTADENKAAAMTLDAKEADEAARVEGTADEETVEKWNNPRINVYRFCAVSWSFVVIGMNDACIGVRPFSPSPDDI